MAAASVVPAIGAFLLAPHSYSVCVLETLTEDIASHHLTNGISTTFSILLFVSSPSGREARGFHLGVTSRGG